MCALQGTRYCRAMSTHENDRRPPGLTLREIEYFASAKRAPLNRIADQLRTICPECDRKLSDLNPDDSAAHDFVQEHAMIGPFVIIGCEGFLTIDPVKLGLNTPEWIAAWGDVELPLTGM